MGDGANCEVSTDTVVPGEAIFQLLRRTVGDEALNTKREARTDQVSSWLPRSVHHISASARQAVKAVGHTR